MCALTWIKVPQWSLTSSVRKSGQIRTMCETGEIAAMEPDLIGQEKQALIIAGCVPGITPQWSLTSSVRKSLSAPTTCGRR